MIRKFLSQDISFKLLILEATLLVLIGRVCVLLLPFKLYASSLGLVNMETPTHPIVSEKKKIKHIENAIEAVSKHTFWSSNCLAQAICCHWMMKRRGIPYTIYLGVKTGKTKRLMAHAWTRVGDKIVTGASGHQNYTTTGMFAYFGK